MSQSEYSTFTKPRLVELLEELREKVEKSDLDLSRKDQIISKTTSILTNKNQSPMDRIQSACLLLGHSEEVLSGKAFELDVEAERKLTGASNKTASTFFNAMKEAGGIEYSTEQAKKVINGKVVYTTQSTIAFTETFDLVNTRSTATKTDLREDEKKRTEARMQKLAVPVCPHCHSDEHISLAPVPICMKCEVQMDPIEDPIPAAELVRIIDETLDALVPDEVRQWVLKNRDIITIASNGEIDMPIVYQTPEVVSYVQTYYDAICSVLKEVAA